jgi:hypothetical protein
MLSVKKEFIKSNVYFIKVAIEQDSVVPSSFYNFGHPGSTSKQHYRGPSNIPGFHSCFWSAEMPSSDNILHLNQSLSCFLSQATVDRTQTNHVSFPTHMTWRDKRSPALPGWLFWEYITRKNAKDGQKCPGTSLTLKTWHSEWERTQSILLLKVLPTGS